VVLWGKKTVKNGPAAAHSQPTIPKSDRLLGNALGLPDAPHAGLGRIVEGGVADLCILEPQARWSVRADTLRSQGKHTPFLGYELPGRVRWTLVGGAVAFERA